MNRRERERLILSIVDERAVGTQAELVEALAERGVEVTQATVSRDIRRIGLVKVPGRDGAYRYVAPDSLDGTGPATREALRAALREHATGIDEARGILVIHTHPGCANAVAAALDRAEPERAVATLAGDDSIFVLTRTDGELRSLRASLEAEL